MTRYHAHASAWMLALLAALLSAGCAGSGRGGSLLNTATHRLLETTRQLRAANPMPLPLPRELEKGILPAYYLEPGDVLLVQPANPESPVRLPADQTVLPDGQIELGVYGRMQVVGKTAEEVEREVQQRITSQTADAGPITVRLVGRQSKVFYVFGEVNTPGAYPLVGRETVLDAIVAAGGVTDAADLGGITFTRPTLPDDCRVVLPICYRAIVQLGDTSTNYQVGPGDRIYVPSMTFCQQLKEMLHGKPSCECPPCDMPQWPCPDVPLQHIPPSSQPTLALPEPVPLPPKGI